MEFEEWFENECKKHSDKAISNFKGFRSAFESAFNAGKCYSPNNVFAELNDETANSNAELLDELDFYKEKCANLEALERKHGRQAEKLATYNMWHNLEKNPDDLPEKNIEVLIKIKLDSGFVNYAVDYMYEEDGSMIWATHPNAIVVAWRRIK